MEAPGAPSSQAEANRWKIKKRTPNLDKLIFPSNETLALRNYIDINASMYYHDDNNHCRGTNDYEKPRQPRPLQSKKPKGKQAEGAWTLPTSVFKGFKDETENLMEKCFHADWQKCENKMKRFIKDSDDIEAVKDILEENYIELMNMFKYSSCVELGEDPFDVQINAASEFCATCDVVESGLATSCGTSDLDTIFIATNYTTKKQKNNPERAIVRYQWMEYVTRISIAKYAKPTAPGDDPLEPPLALDKMLEKNLLPLAKTVDSLYLRHKYFWTLGKKY